MLNLDVISSVGSQRSTQGGGGLRSPEPEIAGSAPPFISELHTPHTPKTTLDPVTTSTTTTVHPLNATRSLSQTKPPSVQQQRTRSGSTDLPPTPHSVSSLTPQLSRPVVGSTVHSSTHPDIHSLWVTMRPEDMSFVFFPPHRERGVSRPRRGLRVRTASHTHLARTSLTSISPLPQLDQKVGGSSQHIQQKTPRIEKSKIGSMSNPLSLVPVGGSQTASESTGSVVTTTTTVATPVTKPNYTHKFLPYSKMRFTPGSSHLSLPSGRDTHPQTGNTSRDGRHGTETSEGECVHTTQRLTGMFGSGLFVMLCGVVDSNRTQLILQCPSVIHTSDMNDLTHLSDLNTSHFVPTTHILDHFDTFVDKGIPIIDAQVLEPTNGGQMRLWKTHTHSHTRPTLSVSQQSSGFLCLFMFICDPHMHTHIHDTQPHHETRVKNHTQNAIVRHHTTDSPPPHPHP